MCARLKMYSKWLTLSRSTPHARLTKLSPPVVSKCTLGCQVYAITSHTTMTTALPWFQSLCQSSFTAPHIPKTQRDTPKTDTTTKPLPLRSCGRKMYRTPNIHAKRKATKLINTCLYLPSMSSNTLSSLPETICIESWDVRKRNYTYAWGSEFGE